MNKLTQRAPPLYEYINGHPYMLASHAAAQMERVIVLTRAEATSDEVIDKIAARVATYLEPVE